MLGTGKIAGAVGDINGRAGLNITAEGDDISVVRMGGDRVPGVGPRHAAAASPLILVPHPLDAFETVIKVARLFAIGETVVLAGANEGGDIGGDGGRPAAAASPLILVPHPLDAFVTGIKVAHLVAIGETVVLTGANAEFCSCKIAAAGDGIAVVREGDDICGGVGHRRDGDGGGADGRGYSRDADRVEGEMHDEIRGLLVVGYICGVALPCAIFEIGEIPGAPVVIWALKIPAAADKVAVVRVGGDIGVERRRRDSSRRRRRRHGNGKGGGAEGCGYGRDADRGESEMHIGSK
ncbi:hypothetical protein PG996_006921 [Apiospora saccharicola]|uniref:Uncharacterized protein n=1 Tax=Apiospora saccharicola TaxID=335842 RepID=A0ABR1V9C6_9PEZI